MGEAPAGVKAAIGAPAPPRGTPSRLAGRGAFLYFGHGLMGYFWRVLEWIGLGLGIAAAAFAAAFVAARRRILRHVRTELGQDSLLLAAGARVGGFDGVADGEGRATPASGILMLLSSGLYFHSWIGLREVFIPGPSISWIGVSESHPGRRGEGHRIVVRFLNASGKQDGVAISLLYPAQWVDAIKTHLITRT
jgi:hypothetical protein